MYMCNAQDLLCLAYEQEKENRHVHMAWAAEGSMHFSKDPYYQGPEIRYPDFRKLPCVVNRAGQVAAVTGQDLTQQEKNLATGND